MAAVLSDLWGLDGAAVSAHVGGMNSRSWNVRLGSRRWIAKTVPSVERRHFEAGLAVAAHVEAAGIPAGAPAAARDGSTVVAVAGDRVLGLLTFVGGAALTGRDDRDQTVIGSVLARAHRALAGIDVPGTDQFHWIDPTAQHLGIREWIRPAIRRALDDWEGIPPVSLSWGLLHSDPAGEAFLLDEETGVCGLIDWDRGLVGPLMYDLASAVMYAGGPTHAGALVRAYLEVGTLTRSEVERALDPMLRLRWAVQADYFARRVATGDMTGIDDPSENEDGLDDAQRGLG